MKRCLLVNCLLALLLFDAALAKQLTIQTPEKQIVVSKPEIESLLHIKVSAPTCHGSDNRVTFEGVSLKNVSESAGVTFGET